MSICFGYGTSTADQGPQVRRTLESRLVAAAVADPLLPESEPTAAIVGKPESAEAGRTLVSFTLRYAGLSNRYCRLAVLDAIRRRADRAAAGGGAA